MLKNTERGRRYPESVYPDDWTSRFECIGELFVEREAEHSDVVKVYQTLNESLEANIIYVSSTVQGMSIVCAIKDLGSFIDSLSEMPGLASWFLTPASQYPSRPLRSTERTVGQG